MLNTAVACIYPEQGPPPVLANSPARNTMLQPRMLLRTVWQYLREVSGENDYARYRARSLAQQQRPLTPEAFYLQRLKDKYSRINRCC